MTDRYVVKSRRFYDGVEATTVLSAPASRENAALALFLLNEGYQNPGNLYIEKWREQ